MTERKNDGKFIETLKKENLVEFSSMAQERRPLNQVKDRDAFLEKKRKEKGIGGGE